MKKISKEKVLASVAATALTFLPLLAFAQTGGDQVGSLLSKIKSWANLLIPIMMALAFIYFVWAIISFINAGDAEKKEVAQTKMINGVIGMTLMGSIWGVSRFLGGVVGVDQNGNSLSILSF